MLQQKSLNSKSEGAKEPWNSYVGVDLSLWKPDVWMDGKYRRYDNTEAGFGKFLIDLQRLKRPALVVFESTGSISLYFAEQLDREGMARACLNPAWIRHHAKSTGRVAKTDKIDCEFSRHGAVGNGSYMLLRPLPDGSPVRRSPCFTPYLLKPSVHGCNG